MVGVMDQTPPKIQSVQCQSPQIIVAIKGKNQTAKPLKEGAKILKLRIILSLPFPCTAPGNDMNLCKVIQVQAKYTKENWSSARG